MCLFRFRSFNLCFWHSYFIFCNVWFQYLNSQRRSSVVSADSRWHGSFRRWARVSPVCTCRGSLPWVWAPLHVLGGLVKMWFLSALHLAQVQACLPLAIKSSVCAVWHSPPACMASAWAPRCRSCGTGGPRPKLMLLGCAMKNKSCLWRRNLTTSASTHETLGLAGKWGTSPDRKPVYSCRHAEHLTLSTGHAASADTNSPSLWHRGQVRGHKSQDFYWILLGPHLNADRYLFHNNPRGPVSVPCLRGPIVWLYHPWAVQAEGSWLPHFWPL